MKPSERKPARIRTKALPISCLTVPHLVKSEEGTPKPDTEHISRPPTPPKLPPKATRQPPTPTGTVAGTREQPEAEKPLPSSKSPDLVLVDSAHSSFPSADVPDPAAKVGTGKHDFGIGKEGAFAVLKDDELERQLQHVRRSIEDFDQLDDPPPNKLLENLRAIEEEIERRRRGEFSRLDDEEIRQQIADAVDGLAVAAEGSYEQEEILSNKEKLEAELERRKAKPPRDPFVYAEPSETAKRLLDRTPVRKTLETAQPIRKSKLTGSGSGNIVQKWDFSDGSAGVWKPKQGESFWLIDYIGGSMYKREAIAADLAEIVGLGHLIPTTIIRRQDGRLGSLQQFMDGAKSGSDFWGSRAKYGGNEEDVALAAALDYWLGQTDRHDSNWLITSDNRLKLIDNGCCLINKDAEINNSELLMRAVRGSLKIPSGVEVFGNRYPAIAKMLEERGFSKQAITLFRQRTEILTECKLFEEVHDVTKRTMKLFGD